MRTRRILTPIVGAATAVILTVAPSMAAGYFTWTTKFKSDLDSRNWSQSGGATTIKADLSCDPNTNVYFIELYRNQLFDKSYGRVRYACGSLQQYTWTGLPKGTYHFHLSKA